MGRGEFYRNKYGGGGRGRGRGRDSGASGGYERATPPVLPTASAPALDWHQLDELLRQLHGRNYGAYHELERVFVYSSATSGLHFRLAFDHVQGDPYASPSRAHVQLTPAAAGFPSDAHAPSKVRNVALCDFLTRCFAASARRAGADATTGM